jgi:lipopolysaccharide export system protein LptC
MAAGRASMTDRSRVVAAAKLVLPLAALVLMSMVFLLAETVDPSRALQGAGIDVEDRARDPRLSAARFAGVTEDGAALRIEAGQARSDPGATLRFQVQDFALWLVRADGGEFTARAQSGLIDRGRGEFAMAGDIHITATPGYDLTATRVSGLLDRTQILVEGPITGQAPTGQLFAGSLTLTAPAEGDHESDSRHLVFRQGVRLIYYPDE